MAPYQIFRTATDHVTIGVAQPNSWISSCNPLEKPELLQDARFKNNADRVANIEEVVPLLEKALVTKSAECWLENLKAAGVLCGVILTTDRALARPMRSITR